MARGRLAVEFEPELRRRVEVAAQSHEISVRDWIERAVRRELEREEAEGHPFARVSVPSFARDWDSEDDAVYDELDR